MLTHHDAEPGQGLRLIGRHDVSEAVAPDPLQPVTVYVPGQAGSRAVVDGSGGHAGVAENARPLLDRLVEAGNV